MNDEQTEAGQTKTNEDIGMINCCGENRNTPFCSKCGRELSSKGATLLGLLAHIRGAATGQRKTIESLKVYQSHKSLPRRQKALAKWESWEQRLVEAIDFMTKSKKKNNRVIND